MGCKKQGGAKKLGHCYSKREEAAWSLLFLNNNDPVFCTLLFAKSRVPDILKVPDPKKISGRPDKLEQWVQIDSANDLYYPASHKVLKVIRNSFIGVTLKQTKTYTWLIWAMSSTSY